MHAHIHTNSKSFVSAYNTRNKIKIAIFFSFFLLLTIVFRCSIHTLCILVDYIVKMVYILYKINMPVGQGRYHLCDMRNTPRREAETQRRNEKKMREEKNERER